MALRCELLYIWILFLFFYLFYLSTHLDVLLYFPFFLQADDGMTVLHYAAKAGHNDILKCLLDTGEIDVNIQDDGGWTPIIWASEHKLVSTVKFLLDQGAQATLKDKVSLGRNKTLTLNINCKFLFECKT